MAQFVWIDWNLSKIDMHALSTAEVEFAWHNRVDTRSWSLPDPGTESYATLPCGRRVKMIWRYNGFGDETCVFVVTAYKVPARKCPGKRIGRHVPKPN
ncbi:hypothetical protein [Fimbriiglobus ruber]|uniref:DUF4258 domain-containing protein n=1 Tax=Fimbriiglobus ruber TaxID=1908690 RepID=A0A225E5W3_9BACT|nr:hypothetical protein [Fimbriiglobus ruber]OWK47154.1 hypothetical protein FRUB_00853 [Fimbriiglobus ruber]